MMLTRRRFVAASSLLATAGRVRPAGADDGASAGPTVSLRAQAIASPQSGGDAQGLLSYGTDPAPRVIRAKPGTPLRVDLANGLADPTGIEWSGVRGYGNVGTADALVASGATRSLDITPPDSGTYRFGPPLAMAAQADRGLAGVLIVEEALPPAVDHDLPLLLLDRADGAGGLPAITVNNRPAPFELTAVPGARIRARLINGSTRRVMLVACKGAKPWIVAIDGQPSELFEPIRDTVPVGPGACFDLMFDLPRDPGAEAILSLVPTERYNGTLETERSLVLFRTAGEARPALPPIAALPPNPALPPQIHLEASKRAELVLAVSEPDKTGRERWTVNSVSGAPLPANPVLRVRQGDAVTLGFSNTSRGLVPLRVTGQAMRLLHTKDDGWEPYWRSAILLPPQSRHHVAFVATTPGRWPIESTLASQWVGGLRCWFEVTKA